MKTPYYCLTATGLPQVNGMYPHISRENTKEDSIHFSAYALIAVTAVTEMCRNHTVVLFANRIVREDGIYPYIFKESTHVNSTQFWSSRDSD